MSLIIDDTDPLVEYDKAETWQATKGWEAYGASSGTLHLTDQYEIAASMNFTGIGIALSGMLNPSGSNFTIMLDGVLSGPYSLHTDSNSQIKVATVFSQAALKDGVHKIVVRKVPDDPSWQSPIEGQKSVLNIDRFIVTTSRAQSTAITMSASSPVPTATDSSLPSTMNSSPPSSSSSSSLSPTPTGRPGNQTIDDTNAFISWDDPSSWQAESGLGSYGLSGGTLHVQHDYNKAVTVWFQGTAIYLQSLMWWTGCNFTVSLDGALSGPYSLLTLDPLQIRPSIVYSARNLDPSQSHILVVRKIPDDPGYVSRLPDEPKSQLNVDSFIISGGGVQSPPDGPTGAPSPPPAPAGAIAGGVVGGVALVFGLVAAFFWHRRRKAYTPRKSKSPTDVLAYQFFPPPASSTMSSIKDPSSPLSVLGHEEMSIATPGLLSIQPFVLPNPSLPSPTHASTSNVIPLPGNRKERIITQPLSSPPDTLVSPHSPLVLEPSSSRAVTLDTPPPNRKGRRRDDTLSSPTNTQPSDSTRLSHSAGSAQSHSNNATTHSPISPVSNDDLRGEIEDLRRELRILQSPNGTADVPPPSYDRSGR